MYRVATFTIAAMLAVAVVSEASAAPRLTATQIAERKKCTDAHKAEIARCNRAFDAGPRRDACHTRAVGTYDECLQRTTTRTDGSLNSPLGSLGTAPDATIGEPTATPGKPIRKEGIETEVKRTTRKKGTATKPKRTADSSDSPSGSVGTAPDTKQAEPTAASGKLTRNEGIKTEVERTN